VGCGALRVAWHDVTYHIFKMFISTSKMSAEFRATADAVSVRLKPVRLCVSGPFKPCADLFMFMRCVVQVMIASLLIVTVASWIPFVCFAVPMSDTASRQAIAVLGLIANAAAIATTTVTGLWAIAAVMRTLKEHLQRNQNTRTVLIPVSAPLGAAVPSSPAAVVPGASAPSPKTAAIARSTTTSDRDDLQVTAVLRDLSRSETVLRAMIIPLPLLCLLFACWPFLLHRIAYLLPCLVFSIGFMISAAGFVFVAAAKGGC
jgi:hypothetical protein